MVAISIEWMVAAAFFLVSVRFRYKTQWMIGNDRYAHVKLIMCVQNMVFFILDFVITMVLYLDGSYLGGQQLDPLKL
jgi:hypothetical protein